MTKMKIKKAVITAAGLSSRLYPHTLDKPKGLLSITGEGLLERSVRILKEQEINQVALVVGYKKEQIVQKLGDTCTCLLNPFYEKCNNMGSLWFAKDFVGNDPFILLHSDLVFDDALIADTLQQFTEESDAHLVVDFGETDAEAMKVRVSQDNYLLDANKEMAQQHAAGEWTGIALVNNSQEFFAAIEDILFHEGLNLYDSRAFVQMAHNGMKIYCGSTGNRSWIEIDFWEDYEKAQELFVCAKF